MSDLWRVVIGVLLGLLLGVAGGRRGVLRRRSAHRRADPAARRDAAAPRRGPPRPSPRGRPVAAARGAVAARTAGRLPRPPDRPRPRLHPGGRVRRRRPPRRAGCCAPSYAPRGRRRWSAIGRAPPRAWRSSAASPGPEPSGASLMGDVRVAAVHPPVARASIGSMDDMDCDNCGARMRWETSHSRCDRCGHIRPCCEGAPGLGVLRGALDHLALGPPPAAIGAAGVESDYRGTSRYR